MVERTMFELLPNELLLDIFEYLYKIFNGINSQLTTMINSIQKFHSEQRRSENMNDTAFADRVTTLGSY
jgi:hypothetical protein